MDARRLLGAMLASGMGGRNQRFGPSGSIGTGALGGILGGLTGQRGGMSPGRQRGPVGLSGALGGGALGMLATLAMQAIQNRQSGSPLQQSGLESSERPEEMLSQDRAILLVRAMIAAANADGQIDENERRRIMEKLEDTGVDPEDRAFIDKELRAPRSLDSLIQTVQGQEDGAQIYAASLFAITVDKESERLYLRRLVDRLGLDEQTVKTLNSQMGLAA